MTCENQSIIVLVQKTGGARGLDGTEGTHQQTNRAVLRFYPFPKFQQRTLQPLWRRLPLGCLDLLILRQKRHPCETVTFTFSVAVFIRVFFEYMFCRLDFLLPLFPELGHVSSFFDQPCSLALLSNLSQSGSRFFPFLSLLRFTCQAFSYMESMFF